MDMDKSRILVPDKKGDYHEIVSVGRTKTGEEANIYFFFPGNFKTLTSRGKTNYQNLLKTNSINGSLITFHEVHLRYPPDGNVHLKLKDSQGKTIFSRYTQHEKISKLTAAKRIFTILPTNIDRYPVYDQNKEFDWKIKYDLIPEFFVGQPIRLNFWIGVGEEKELQNKAKAIQCFEMDETLRYVEVFFGQSQNLQLFLSISRPKEFEDFPKSMWLFLHPRDTTVLKRKKNGP